MSEWTDEDGRPLGQWAEITSDEWTDLYAELAGERTVFATLTDPDGQYGERQVYTAYGHRNADAPHVDICDYKDASGSTTRTVLRKFVAADAPAPERNHEPQEAS